MKASRVKTSASRHVARPSSTKANGAMRSSSASVASLYSNVVPPRRLPDHSGYHRFVTLTAIESVSGEIERRGFRFMKSASGRFKSILIVAICLLSGCATQFKGGVEAVSPRPDVGNGPRSVDSLNPTLRWKSDAKEARYDLIIYSAQLNRASDGFH